jgi:hypothetical protein
LLRLPGQGILTRARRRGWNMPACLRCFLWVSLVVVLSASETRAQDDWCSRCFTYDGETQVSDSAFDMQFTNQCGKEVTVNYWRKPGRDQDGKRRIVWAKTGTHTVRCNGSRDWICTSIVNVEFVCPQQTAEGPSRSDTRKGVPVEEEKKTAQPTAPGVDVEAAKRASERFDFQLAEKMDSREGWEAFLKAHPDGVSAAWAKKRLKELGGDAAAPKSSLPRTANVPQAPLDRRETILPEAEPVRCKSGNYCAQGMVCLEGGMCGRKHATRRCADGWRELPSSPFCLAPNQKLCPGGQTCWNEDRCSGTKWCINAGGDQGCRPGEQFDGKDCIALKIERKCAAGAICAWGLACGEDSKRAGQCVYVVGSQVPQAPRSAFINGSR